MTKYKTPKMSQINLWLMMHMLLIKEIQATLNLFLKF